MKKIRHLTLEEYEIEILPLVTKLKALLRKKFLFNTRHTSGFEFFTADQYIESKVAKTQAMMNKIFSENFDLNNLEEHQKKHIEEAIAESEKEASEVLQKHKIKATDKMPEGYLEEVSSILEQLKTLYTLPRIVDWSKAHRGHKEEVRYCMDRNVYILEMLNGELAFHELEAIAASVGVKIPKRVSSLVVDAEAKYVRKCITGNGKGFVEAMQAALSPYTLQLRTYILSELERICGGYAKSNYKDPVVYGISKLDPQEFRYLLAIEQKGWEVGSEEICSNYINELTLRFYSRMDEKLAAVSKKHGEPKIELHNLEFSGGVVEASLTLEYKGGLKIGANTKLIIAGGDVQRLHYRYLSTFAVGGKKLSQEQLDSL